MVFLADFGCYPMQLRLYSSSFMPCCATPGVECSKVLVAHDTHACCHCLTRTRIGCFSIRRRSKSSLLHEKLPIFCNHSDLSLWNVVFFQIFLLLHLLRNFCFPCVFLYNSVPCISYLAIHIGMIGFLTEGICEFTEVILA